MGLSRASGRTGDVIPFFVGIVITAEAITSSGLAGRVSRAVAACVGNDPKTTVFMLLVTGVVLSMCIGNISAAAIVMPLGLALLESSNAPRGRSNLGRLS